MTLIPKNEQLETLISEQESLSEKESLSEQKTRFPRTLFLDVSFAVPDFFLGMASILDFRGVLLDKNIETQSGYEKDVAALRDDWNVIGQDFYRVIDTFPQSEETET